MSLIPIFSLNTARLLLQEKGVDLQTLYSHCEVNEDDFHNKDCWVPVTSMVRSLELVEKYSDGRPLSLLMISYIPMTAFGDFGVDLLTAPTYNEALKLLIEFGHVIAPGLHFSSTQTADYVTINIRNEGYFQQFGEVVVEVTLLQIQRFIASQQSTSLAVQHAPPRKKAIAEPLLPLFEFNAASNSITFPAQLLNQKIELAEPTMHAHAIQSLKKIESQELLHKPFAMKVRKLILNALAEGGSATLESVAALMSTTPRTVSRKLKQEDILFKTLLTDARMDVAKQLIECQVSLKIISAKLGFRSQQGFVMAFQRQMGCTPAAWKEQHKNPAKP